MRVAKPNELKSYAVPVLTAHLNEAELARWIPIAFSEVSDPLAVPEPSKGALVQLASGKFVVLFYGKESGTLFLRVPENANASACVREFLNEVKMPASRVVWRRQDVSLPAKSPRPTPSSPRPRRMAAKRTSSGFRGSRPATRAASRSSKKR